MAEMKFSTGNQIQGKIMEIRKGAVTAIVYVVIPGDVAGIECHHRLARDAQAL
jgi:molybdopterin-binding protein